MKIGDSIPEYLGKDQDGIEITKSSLKGKKVILYFYPKDNTPGCTAEACSMRDEFGALKDAGYTIIGVSVDSSESHEKFIQKHQLPFQLIADTDKHLVNAFDVWKEKSMAGRKYMGTLRTTFLIDENGIITHIFNPKDIKTKQHALQILELVK